MKIFILMIMIMGFTANAKDMIVEYPNGDQYNLGDAHSIPLPKGPRVMIYDEHIHGPLSADLKSKIGGLVHDPTGQPGFDQIKMDNHAMRDTHAKAVAAKEALETKIKDKSATLAELQTYVEKYLMK